MSEKSVTSLPCNFVAAIVTGGSSGIGNEFLKVIKRLSPNLSLCNISRTKSENFSELNTLLHIGADLSDKEEIDNVSQKVREWLKNIPEGPILLINNSGYGLYGYSQALDRESQLNMMDLNMRACVDLTNRLLPILCERQGWIVNVASTAAFQPTPYMAVYGASKSFLMHWSLALDEELSGTGVRSLVVCPGPTSTNFFARAGFSEAPLSNYPGQTPDQVVAETFKAIRKGRNLVVSGTMNKMMSSLSSRLPKSLGTKLTAKILRKMRLEQMSAK